MSSYARVKDFRHRLKEYAVKAFGGECSVCGYSKCIQAFDFHHLNGEEKDFAISRYANLNFAVVAESKEEAERQNELQLKLVM